MVKFAEPPRNVDDVKPRDMVGKPAAYRVEEFIPEWNDGFKPKPACRLTIFDPEIEPDLVEVIWTPGAIVNLAKEHVGEYLPLELSRGEQAREGWERPYLVQFITDPLVLHDLAQLVDRAIARLEPPF